MNDKNQIKELMSELMENVKNVVNVDTVVGSVIDVSEEIKLIPITKISVGFVSGGGEYGADKKIIKTINKIPFAGGGGGGVSVSPVGFLEIKNGSCKLIRLSEKSVYQNVLDKLPLILNSVSNVINNADKNAKKS